MNKQKVVISILSLICILLASFLIVTIQTENAAKLSYTIGSSTLSTQDQMSMNMMLKPFDVPATETVPTVDFVVTKDLMGDGWTVHATTTNFTFTPEHLNQAPVPGEGHMHLYIDNELIVMLSPWYHIDSFTKGTHTIKISLNNNDHSVYTSNGNQIETTKTLTVS